ncbi:DNA adenine methylase [Alkalihalobacillus sp. AL-G]|uniref:DNA adenine methylase n=1 Tax=Alkalihalobacillus sp. AL-G TaxID=2926399 RepID=UPI00272C23A2|nr:DNA adenine methylase [Alkalihalobacillus sp. AL-G]WLD91757.1 DNA adenine methylase [Alkalihalobacillus sp. AL-G]
MPNIKNKKLPQLLKWIGNKQRFAEEIVDTMPREFNSYYEPFLGSGAVLATLCDRKRDKLMPTHSFDKAVGSDVMTPLIEVFKYVKDDPETLINHYKECIENFNDNRKENYLKIRDSFNENHNGLDFAVLTRTCYSGVIRFRKSDGYMSTPIGPHNPISPASFAERVKEWHDLLHDVTFLNNDFRETMSLAREGDVVYCDPPYTHSQTILYGSQSFKIEDLWQSIYECKQRGAKVILSINGQKKSKSEDISVEIPDGLFERGKYVNCGVSMINRLQRSGAVMENEDVHDRLLLTW